MTSEYGKACAADRSVIDRHLARVPRGGVVVNLGCGPNWSFELNNLARAMARLQPHSTLLLADRSAAAIEHKVWIPGPDTTRVVQLDAIRATDVLGTGRADIVLALGLFGALDADAPPDKTTEEVATVVLRECFALLKPGGQLLVSNSTERQPIDSFIALVTSVGFAVAYRHVGLAIWGQEKPGDERYLMTCEKAKRE